MAKKKEFDSASREIEAKESASLEALLNKVAGIEEAPEAAAAPSGDESAKAEKKAKAEKAKKAPHSTKHQEAVKLVDKNKTYSLEDAIALIKKTSYTKFDGALDVHVRLTAAKKTDEVVRGTVTLPHGTGKERKVVIIDEAMIEKIEKGWLDFDVAVTTPAMMPKLAKLAKILGPKGLMPNPKSGTVSPDPEKVVAELRGGRVEFKSDSHGNIHQSLGRVSWDAAKLTENFQTFVTALPKSRVKSIALAPTMGPGAKVSL